ncbi:MAG: hypothetical protein P1U32_03505 [Legionellaceae bacterium]|nr:hypothetical protein [Legionellaceae bacterium]
MTLFSEVIQAVLLKEINARIKASNEADELCEEYDKQQRSGYSKTLSGTKREHLEALKTNLQAIEAAEDDVFLTTVQTHIAQARRNIDEARRKENKEPGKTEPMLNMIRQFSEDLLGRLECLELKNEPRVDEPLCRLYHAITLYTATRELERNRKIAHPPSFIGYLTSRSTYLPEEPFLNALDKKISDCVNLLKSNLKNQQPTDEDYQEKRDNLANRLRKSLKQDEKDLRDFFGFLRAGPDYLTPSFAAAGSTLNDEVDVRVTY